MKERKEIIKKIIKLERELKEERQNNILLGNRNLSLVNEPLYNQTQALRWALSISLDEQVDAVVLN